MADTANPAERARSLKAPDGARHSTAQPPERAISIVRSRTTSAPDTSPVCETARRRYCFRPRASIGQFYCPHRPTVR